MNEDNKSTEGRTKRTIIGFSLTPEMAREVKIEAAQRNITLKALFEELWQNYKKSTRNKVKI